MPDPKSTAGYTIDHSSIIYVMGPDGAYRTHFTHATSADAMAERLAKHIVSAIAQPHRGKPVLP